MTAADHDAGLAERIAAALREEYAASLTPPPPKPPAAPVPDWLFGPRHRELDRQRQEAAEAARHELPALAAPAEPAPAPVDPPAHLCPWCRQPYEVNGGRG